MNDEVDLNLSVLLRAILNKYGQITLPISDLSQELDSDKEYKVLINLVDKENIEISLEEK